MESIRKINDIEIVILNYLIANSSIQLPKEFNDNFFVQKMNDGGMGSFSIFPDVTDILISRKFGKQISEFEFIDDDGVTVIISLSVDEKNKPFEIDIWKTDYTPVINLKIPTKK